MAKGSSSGVSEKFDARMQVLDLLTFEARRSNLDGKERNGGIEKIWEYF